MRALATSATACVSAATTAGVPSTLFASALAPDSRRPIP